MTHDELLAKIDGQKNTIVTFDSDSEVEVLRLMKFRKALRAVVEYHKPYESKNYGLLCNGCDETPNYPCGTIRAIEKELE
jgi:hypothetical protein